MSQLKRFSTGEAKKISEAVGIEVELEHGTRDPATDITHDDPLLTGKIALAHLNELPDYYTRLALMEQEDRNE